ncbi:hypothetical protein [Flavobacterium sp.]|uniref:hypothetical protein n=1 Tax=Flavobacterium sp. TaxID=239 RepID=UPI0037503204
MNKKSVKISLSFAILFLIAILVQSIHSYAHFSDLKTEKKCHHNHYKNVAEVNDSHIKSHHCFTCEFTFSNALKSEVFTILSVKKIISVFYSFTHSKEIISHFKGSLFALRAPPNYLK